MRDVGVGFGNLAYPQLPNIDPVNQNILIRTDVSVLVNLHGSIPVWGKSQSLSL